MILFIAIIFVITATIQARTFNNPILEGRYNWNAGAIKVNGTYYIARSTFSGSSEKFPIHVSTDLANWTSAGYIFNETNIPVWTRKDGWFMSPEIHQIGSTFIAYFSAQYNADSYQRSIGAAISTHPLGPYVTTDRPLLIDSTADVYDLTIINDNGTLYLLWMSGNSIKGRLLTANGLGFSSGEVTELLQGDLLWEDSNVEGPWYVRRGDYHYLMYSGNYDCYKGRGVGVARSHNPLGPYEKKGSPFFVSIDDFEETSHISLVKDLDDQNDVIVAHAFCPGQVCGPWPVSIVLASVGWSSDSWPYVNDL